MNFVRAWGPGTADGRVYARAAGMRVYHHPWLDSTATNYRTTTWPGAPPSVELPPAVSPPTTARRRCVPS